MKFFFRKEKDRRKEDIWYRIEELAKRNPNYAPIKNNSIESSCDDTGFRDQEPDIDMSYEKVQAESKKVSFTHRIPLSKALSPR